MLHHLADLVEVLGVVDLGDAGKLPDEEYVETCERYARLCLKIGIMLDSLQQYGDAMHYIEIAEREINRCYPGEKPVFIKCIQTAVVCLVQ